MRLATIGMTTCCTFSNFVISVFAEFLAILLFFAEQKFYFWYDLAYFGTSETCMLKMFIKFVLDEDGLMSEQVSVF